jgi:hypothetical protein
MSTKNAFRNHFEVSTDALPNRESKILLNGVEIHDVKNVDIVLGSRDIAQVTITFYANINKPS